MHTIKQTQGGPYPSIYKPTSWRLASAADDVIPRLENFPTGHGVLTNGCHQLAGKRREPPWRCTIVDVKRVAHPPEGRATRLTAGSSSYLDSCWWIKVSQNSHGALPSEPRPPELRPVASFRGKQSRRRNEATHPYQIRFGRLYRFVQFRATT